jgi:O-antigen/teichoic acid export membrane protein
MSGPSRRRMLGSATWATLQQIVTLGGTAISGIMLARVLTKEEFGIFSYATTVAGVGMTIMTAGLSSLAIKQFVQNPDRQRTTMTALVAIRELCAVVAYIVLLVVSLSSGTSEIIAVTAIALAVLFARAFDATEFWFQSRVESHKPAIVRITAVLLFLAIRLVLAISGADLVTFIFLYVAEAVVITIGLLLRYRVDKAGTGFGKVDPALIKSMMGQSWILLLAGIAAQVNSRGDIFVLQALLGSEAVGTYAAAARFSELFYFLPVVITTATFPALLATRKKEGETSVVYKKMLQRSYDLACWGGVAVAALVFFVGPPLITLLYGEEYATSGVILQVHVLALPLVFMAAVFSKWIVAEHLLLASLWRHSIGAALNIALNFLLIPQLGVIGAAYATVASYVVASYLSCFVGKRTRIAGIQMTLALVAPVRAVVHAVKSKGTP